MLRPDASTSNARWSIDELARGLDLAAEVGIAHGLRGDEIHAPAQQLFEGLAEIKIAIRVLRGRLPIRHLHHEVHVAGRLHPIGGG